MPIRAGSCFLALVLESCLLAPGAIAAQQEAPAPAKPAAPAAKAAAPDAKPATPAGAEAPAPADAKAAAPAFKPEELDQLAAPIALYPDAIIAQVLMAATYPLEVVQASRWVKANSKLKGDALAAALEKQTWDASVKSLVNFPQVLDMMNEKLDWTQKLGDAVIAQQKDVMDAIQRLRAKAKDSGNLQTTKEQKVTVEPSSQTIIIESANPQVVYVPTYNPTVVYGAWPYPAYPPYYYYPPGYVATTAAFSFAAGVAIGAAWSHAWGGCNWHGGEIDIDVDKNININDNRNTNRNTNAAGQRAGTTGASQQKGAWKHDSSHRQGVSYRDQATAQKYKGAGPAASTSNQARQDFRGRTGGSTPSATPSTRTPSAGRSGTSAASPSSRASSSSSAFGGYSKGSDVKREQSRGTQSRASSSSSSVRSSGGGARSSGGGARCSGGGRSGGGGGRRR